MTTGTDIVAGLHDAIAHARGDQERGRVSAVEVPRHIDVRELRHRLEMSQEAFALAFGFSLATVRNWEQGHRQPDGSARVLLTLIDRIPEQIQEALRAA